MATLRPNTDPLQAGDVEEDFFPDLSDEDKRALIESLEEADRQIARGEYRMFDAEAILRDLKDKFSSR